MGINSNCYIPNDVRADDLVQAIAYLCGAERIRKSLTDGSFAAHVKRQEVSTEPNKPASLVKIESTHRMQYFEIVIEPTTCDNQRHLGSLFLFPSSEHKNRMTLNGGVSKFWKEIGRALVDFFGGEVDDNDCDSVQVDYKKKKPRKSNCPDDGQDWGEFQNAMLNMPKLYDFVKVGEHDPA